ncbi:MAG TPA: hypothetical protein PKD12_08090 [Nitrospira sp.]|nr:hypothetical protein [Nitrospira sp.]
MTRHPHDQNYLEWLQGQVALPADGRTYHQLIEALHEKEYVWLIPNDDNRAEDGLELRREYFHEYGENPGEEGATVLEVLVALSRRITFLADGEAEQWAWQLIQNLEIDKCWDPLTARKIRELDNKLDGLIWRTYHRDGQGGFFPLAWPEEDQSKVELWYQMNSFIEELPEM